MPAAVMSFFEKVLIVARFSDGIFMTFMLTSPLRASSSPARRQAKTYSLIDLFCGCGGLTQGYLDTRRFQVALANDNNKDSIDTYRANFDRKCGHSHLCDIETLVSTIPMPAADVVIGGPPCQGFSLLNKKRGPSDLRRSLWYQFLQVADSSRARVIQMENVPQILGSVEFMQIVETLKSMGFKHIMAGTLMAANYGAPQARRRAIILASKRGRVALPIPTHLQPRRLEGLGDAATAYNLKPWNTVRSAISDLPRKPIGTEISDESAPLNLHFGRKPRPESLERYKVIPEGGNRFDLLRIRPDLTSECWKNKKDGGTDLFGRLWWDRPSVTIRTEFYKPEKGRYLHPTEDRPITHREAARLQGFKDGFSFSGSKIQIARQIGNAVPVTLAQAIAEQVIKTLQNSISIKDVESTKTAFIKLTGKEVIAFDF